MLLMACFRLSIEPVMFLYTIIYVTNFEILPQMLLTKMCYQENVNSTICAHLGQTSDINQQKAARWWWLILGCQLVTAMVMILLIGPLSDKIGRRKGFLAIPIINSLQNIVYFLNAYFVKAHPAYLILGSVMSGLYGDMQGVILLCFAYTADLTCERRSEKRTLRMALVESSFFLAAICGGLLSGSILKTFGFTYTFVCNLAIDVAIYAVVFFTVKDRSCMQNEENELDNTQDCLQVNEESSLVAKPSTSFVYDVVDRLKGFKECIFNGETNHLIIPAILSYGFTLCCTSAESQIFVLYLRNSPFHFSSMLIAWFIAFNALLRAIAPPAAIFLLQRYMRLSDYSLVVFGIVWQVLWLVLAGVARSKTEIFLFALAGMFAPVAFIVLRSIVTKKLGSNRHGSAMAALEIVDVLATLLMLFLGMFTYQSTADVYSGISFFLLSFISFLCLVNIVVCIVRNKLELIDQGT